MGALNTFKIFGSKYTGRVGADSPWIGGPVAFYRKVNQTVEFEGTSGPSVITLLYNGTKDSDLKYRLYGKTPAGNITTEDITLTSQYNSSLNMYSTFYGLEKLVLVPSLGTWQPILTGGRKYDNNDDGHLDTYSEPGITDTAIDDVIYVMANGEIIGSLEDATNNPVPNSGTSPTTISTEQVVALLKPFFLEYCMQITNFYDKVFIVNTSTDIMLNNAAVTFPQPTGFVGTFLGFRFGISPSKNDTEHVINYFNFTPSVDFYRTGEIVNIPGRILNPLESTSMWIETSPSTNIYREWDMSMRLLGKTGSTVVDPPYEPELAIDEIDTMIIGEGEIA